MRLSGVDPGIIRELSGIYKPFIKAFKELISNAYDADAENIGVTVADDFQGIEVRDDGIGMTPFHFESDFARLGGSTAWLQGGKSPGGRPRIGYKGIGFLAVARYCSELRVTSHATRPYEGSRVITRGNRKSIDLIDLIGDVVPVDLLEGKIRIVAVEAIQDGASKKLKKTDDYILAATELRLTSKRALARELRIDYVIDCSDLTLEAVLDFDYLLGLEHREDLRTLDNFCRVKVKANGATQEAPFTAVTLHRLKDFVVRELSAPPVKGKARNIVFKSGYEQFRWRLARASPIHDDIPAEIDVPEIKELSKFLSKASLPTVTLKWGREEPERLARQVYLRQESPQSLPLKETVFPVNIKEGGLHVRGYLLARSEVLYPAELRGLSIRVRHVAIGDASFLGWEHIMSGPRKAALSQISGELIVLDGLEASDAINPGRESFYEENPHYRILKRELFGTGEAVGGIVGQAVASILGRIRVRAQVTDRITEAKQRRKALADISSAVSFYARSGGPASTGLASFFKKKQKANGLALVKDVPLKPPARLGGFEVETSTALDGDFQIDFHGKRVLFDYRQDAWNTKIYLGGHYYEVVLKQGKPDHPICEFDNQDKRIYVNWAHPAKTHMNDVAFLKSAILLRLAYHATPFNADAMMDLAVNMLAFRAD
jgi:Histidine kinase-, DNA gyrase B-, and HSP90-like ATPase